MLNRIFKQDPEPEHLKISDRNKGFNRVLALGLTNQVSPLLPQPSCKKPHGYNPQYGV